MTLDQFHNRLRTMYNIDGWRLSFLTEEQQAKFVADPAKFLIRADDPTAIAIWLYMERLPK